MTKLFPSSWQPQPIALFFNVLKGGKLASLKVFFFQKYIMQYGETSNRRRGPTPKSNSEIGLFSIICSGCNTKILEGMERGILIEFGASWGPSLAWMWMFLLQVCSQFSNSAPFTDWLSPIIFSLHSYLIPRPLDLAILKNLVKGITDVTDEYMKTLYMHMLKKFPTKWF